MNASGKTHCKNCVVNVTTNYSDVHHLNPSLLGSDVF